MKRKIFLFLGTSFFIASCVSLLFFKSQRKSPSLQLESNAPPVCSFQSSEQTFYTLGVEINFQVAGEGNIGSLLAQGAQNVSLKGLLEWTPLFKRSEGWEIQIQVHNLQLNTSTEANQSTNKQHTLMPFRVLVDSSCRFISFGFPTTYSSESQAKMKGLMQALEVVIPNQHANTWLLQEWDSVGQYTAQYQRTKDSHSNTFHKTRIQYDSLFSLPQEKQVNKRSMISTSLNQFKLGESIPWIQSLESNEKYTIDLNSQTQLYVSSHITLQHKQTLQNQVVSTEYDLTWHPAEVHFFSKKRGNEAQIIPHYSLYELSKICSAVEKLLGERSFFKALDLLIHAIKQWPQALEALYSQVLSQTFSESMQKLFFLALSKAGTKESQSVLKRAIEDQALSLINRQRAIVALSTSEEKDKDTVLSILEIANTSPDPQTPQGLTNSAKLAIGNIARTLSPKNRDLETPLIEKIQEWITQAQRAEEQSLALAVIGNTGKELFSETTASYAQSKNKDVRAVAYHAMRKMPSHTTQDSFKKGIQHEENNYVLQRMFQALTENKPLRSKMETEQLCQNASSRLNKEGNQANRLAIIQFLGRQCMQSPEAKEALGKQFWRESASRMKKEIGKYLSVQWIDLQKPQTL